MLRFVNLKSKDSSIKRCLLSAKRFKKIKKYEHFMRMLSIVFKIVKKSIFTKNLFILIL